MGTTLLGGNEESNSAKRRRQHAYAQDLELQMREKEAAKLRERYQGMNVDASGWLDPEKRPDRLKPLGGDGFMTSRSDRDTKVKPYHTLFNYGQVPPEGATNFGDALEPGPQRSMAPGDQLQLRQWHLNLDTPAGLQHHPLTEATAGRYHPNDSIHQAYNYYATRDIDRPGTYGSIIQPLVVPYVDNRPIIMPGRYETTEYHHKYNPFEHNYNDSLQKDIRALLGFSQLERERTKAQMTKENEDYQRRMRRELEDERRRLLDQENEARRRMEQMRKEWEDRRREWERQMRESQRAKQEAADAPKTAPVVIRPPSTTLLSDMDETRKRLIDERRKIEELLKASMNQPEYTEVKVLKRPPPPPTPPDSDMANRRVIEEFNFLKHMDEEARKAFLKMYPELPETNIRLEAQQRALLRQQEEALKSLHKDPKPAAPQTEDQGNTGRLSWLDKSLTPFPHRVRHSDRLYTSHSLNGDLDRLVGRAERHEWSLAGARGGDEFDRLRLRAHRSSSTETLTDDTWMRPASASVV